MSAENTPVAVNKDTPVAFTENTPAAFPKNTPVAFPKTVLLRQAVQQALVLSGKVKTDRLARVKSAVIAAPETFEVNLEFERNELEKPCANLAVKGYVELECQRCLGLVRVELESSTQLVFVAHDDEARTVTGARDPWIVSGDTLDIDELLEDEILLALPGVPLHEKPGDSGTGGCIAVPMEYPDPGSTERPAVPEAEEAVTRRPFDVLAKLKE